MSYHMFFVSHPYSVLHSPSLSISQENVLSCAENSQPPKPKWLQRNQHLCSLFCIASVRCWGKYKENALNLSKAKRREQQRTTGTYCSFDFCSSAEWPPQSSPLPSGPHYYNDKMNLGIPVPYQWLSKSRNECSIIKSQVEHAELKTLREKFHYWSREERNREKWGIRIFFYKSSTSEALLENWGH